MEHGDRQGPELLEGIFTNALQQLRSADVHGALSAAGVALAELPDGMIQPLPGEKISPSVEPRVFLANQLDDRVEIEVLHASSRSLHMDRLSATSGLKVTKMWHFFGSGG
jgi:hypothetical protein